MIHLFKKFEIKEKVSVGRRAAEAYMKRRHKKKINKNLNI